VSQPPARSNPLLWLIVLISLLAIFAALPVHRCGNRCEEDYAHWMRAASTPWATPSQSAEIRAWAAKYGCDRCNNTGRITCLRWWLELLDGIGRSVRCGVS
jgi:hypothetical protein